MWRPFALVFQLALSDVDVGVPLPADDECQDGQCALSALQLKQSQPWYWRMRQPWQEPPAPAYPWMQPMQSMQPMQPMQPILYPWMQPLQPMEPQPMPPAPAESTVAPTSVEPAPSKTYIPLAPTGWGMIADNEGEEIAQLTTSKVRCEEACSSNPRCNSFVFCTFGGCYLKTGQFYTGNEPMHYSGFCSTFWTPQAGPDTGAAGTVTLPPLRRVEVHQCEKGTVPEPSGSCSKSTSPKLMTFYQYRAQSGQMPKGRLWENMNLANLGGVMFYLHNEVVDKEGEMRDASGARTTKFQVDRILRFKVTVKNSAALWKKFRSQFGQFIQFDYGQATFGMPDHVKKCNAIWSEFGYEVGCQANPTGISGYDDGYWTSWPGRCPSMPFTDQAPQGGPAKTTQCIKEQPGGSCGSPNGSFDCIWNVAEAGFVMLDDLVGTDIKKLYEAGGWQYEKKTDSGKGTSFWNGKKDRDKCKEREEKLLNLFAQKYRDQPASLTDPYCDFWR